MSPDDVHWFDRFLCRLLGHVPCRCETCLRAVTPPGCTRCGLDHIPGTD